jgi:hypothetical protein
MTNIEVSNAPDQKKPDTIPVKVDPVARSLAREDAFMKPGRVGHAKVGAPKGDRVRVRLTNQRPPGRPRKRPRDPRDVKYW